MTEQKEIHRLELDAMGMILASLSISAIVRLLDYSERFRLLFAEWYKEYCHD